MIDNLIKYVRDAGFPLDKSVINLFVGGSELHGAKVKDTDDLDIYGVFIEPPILSLGLDKYEHFVYSTAGADRRNGPDEIDICLYSLRKLAGLLCKGNPTALNFLFAFNDVGFTDMPSAIEWGTLSASLKRLTISKKSASSFIGFVDAQMGRLLGTRGRGKKGQRPELEEKFGYNCKAGMHAVRLLKECIELMSRHRLTFPRPEKDMLIEVRTGQWSLDRLSDEVNRLMVELKDARDRSSLPDTPDRVAVSNLVTDAYLAHWERKKAA